MFPRGNTNLWCYRSTGDTREKKQWIKFHYYIWKSSISNTSNCETKSIDFTTTITIPSKSCLCTNCMHQQFYVSNWFRNYLDLVICELIPLQRVLDQPVCSMLVYYSQAWLTVPVYMCALFCDLLWPEFQSHSDDTHTHVTAPCSAHVLAQKCGHVNDLFSTHWQMSEMFKNPISHPT